MKQIVSILLLIALAFAGGSSIMHQLEQQEAHCHEDGTHLCESEAHHHCSLCDTLTTAAFVSDEIIAKDAPQREITYAKTQVSSVYTLAIRQKLGRAPPMA